LISRRVSWASWTEPAREGGEEEGRKREKEEKRRVWAGPYLVWGNSKWGGRKDEDREKVLK
jgi:hypothetical protein